jgi:hypothetical protein
VPALRLPIAQLRAHYSNIRRRFDPQSNLVAAEFEHANHGRAVDYQGFADLATEN